LNDSDENKGDRKKMIKHPRVPNERTLGTVIPGKRPWSKQKKQKENERRKENKDLGKPQKDWPPLGGAMRKTKKVIALDKRTEALKNS